MNDMMSALNKKLLARKKMAEGDDGEKSGSNDEPPKTQSVAPVVNKPAPSSPFNSSRNNSISKPAVVAPAVKNTVARGSISSSTDDTNVNNLREELIKVIRDEVQAAKEEIIEVLRQELRK